MFTVFFVQKTFKIKNPTGLIFGIKHLNCEAFFLPWALANGQAPMEVFFKIFLIHGTSTVHGVEAGTSFFTECLVMLLDEMFFMLPLG